MKINDAMSTTTKSMASMNNIMDPHKSTETMRELKSKELEWI